MRTEGHIGYTETLLLAFTVLSATAILPVPALAVRLGQTGAWLLMLLIGATAAALSLLTAALLERHPGRGLARVAEDVAGPVAGTVLNVALLAWLLAELALTLRLFTEMFITAILPNTPPSAIAVGMMVMMLYAAHAGLEPAARTSVILAPPVALAFLAILVANSRDVRIDWLFPLWGPGPANLALTAVQWVGLSAGVVLLPVHGYALREAGLFRRAGLLGLGVAFAALAASVAVYVALFGVEGGGLEPFPLYSMARLVYLGRFLQRFEAAFVLFWAWTAMVYLAVVLHGAAVTAATALAVPYYRPLLYPLALVSFSLSLLPRNFPEAMQWHQQFRAASSLVAFGLPALLLLISLVRAPACPQPPAAARGDWRENALPEDGEVTLR